jgi:hypothetical protein
MNSLIVNQTSVLCAVRNLGEPREASRFLRRNNRAFGALPHRSPYQTAPLPAGMDSNSAPPVLY